MTSIITVLYCRCIITACFVSLLYFQLGHVFLQSAMCNIGIGLFVNMINKRIL